MDSLPLETFQLICSYCSLYTLAHLRLVSKSFLNKVDGSLNARRRQLGIVKSRSTTKPATAAARNPLAELTDPRKAGFITMTLGKGRVPMEIAFNGYNPKYNYLEFIQKSPPNIVSVPQINSAMPPATQNMDLTATTNPMVQYAVNELRRQEDLEPASLGKLVLHSWEQDKLDRDAGPIAFAGTTESLTAAASSSSASTRLRRSSIGQTLAQRRAEAKEDRASYMTRITQAFWGATNISGSNSNTSVSTATNSTSSTSTSTSAAANPTALDALVQAAQSRFYANDPELSPQDRQYKFDLTPGEHFLGDTDWMIKYTVGKPIDGERLFEVDYIRVSWKWIVSGIGPIPGTGRKASSPVGNAAASAASTATEDGTPTYFPSSSAFSSVSIKKRLGGIYTERLQRVIDEVKKQDISKIVRGELALQGYSDQLLPRDYLSVNLHAEPVVAWVMRTDPDQLSGDRDDWNDEDDDGNANRSSMDNNVLQKVEQEKDQQELERMVAQMKDRMGYLTCRCVLEEMLVHKGLSRSLVWTVGRVRRQLMDPVPPPAVTQDLVRILDTTNQQRMQQWQQQQNRPAAAQL